MKAGRLIVFVFFYFISNSVLAQSLTSIEADLLKSFKRIDYWRPTDLYDSDSTKSYNIDSLSQANTIFSEKLLHYTSISSPTISQRFKSFDNLGLGQVRSTDGLLKIYFWDTGLGGTQQDYLNVIQYKIGKKTKSIVPNDANIKIPTYDTIYTLKRGNNIYYLAIYSAKMDYREHLQGIQVFSIRDGVLNDNVKLIKTNSGMHSRLEYSYNDTFIYEDASEEWPSIQYDPKFAILKIPVVLENGKANGKHIIYKFNGQYFEKLKNNSN